MTQASSPSLGATVIEVVTNPDKRRVIIDWGILLALVACVTVFAEMRSGIATLQKATEAQEAKSNRLIERLEVRLIDLERRELTNAATLANKSDLARVEMQLENLRSLIIRQRDQ